MQVDKIIEKNYSLKIKGVEFIIKNEKVRIINKKAFEIMKKLNLKIKYYGFYLGKIKRNNKFVFSLDATSLFNYNIKNNVIEINENQLSDWLDGKNIKMNFSEENFVVLKFNDYFIGSGYYKNGEIINFLPKKRFIANKIL